MALDDALIQRIMQGDAVLFLGAGASLGAADGAGRKIPSTPELAGLIRREFLSDDYDNCDFVEVCDYATTARGKRELQRFIHKAIEPFLPAPFHLRIPRIPWAGLATTNFDLLVERAYGAPGALKRLLPLVSDKPEFFDMVAAGDLVYLKLHGCVSAYEQTSPGMIFSTESILRHIEGRAAQFNQLMEWAVTKTIIFAGYSLRDHDLRSLVDRIIKEGDNRPKHYIVKKGVLPLEADYWSERRFTLIDSTFEQFIEEVDKANDGAFRGLAALRSHDATSLGRFIASKRQPSQVVSAYLSSSAEHVSDATTSAAGAPQKFFNGFDLGWYPIEAGLDFDRPVVKSILQEQIAATSVRTPQLIVLKAHAGAGKSVALRRVAWDAARRLGKLVIYVPNHGQVAVQALQEIAELTQEPVFLVVDDLTTIADSVAELMATARRNQLRIVIIGGARPNEWNVRAQNLEPLVTEEYKIEHMTRSETRDLLSRLEKSDCLGELKHLPVEERVRKFDEVFGRQLLVALHEATRNASFRDIIKDEYSKIAPAEAQLLYADICALHRLGSPVRAGLLKRVHGIGFEQFHEKFFRPLEQVVALEMDSRSGDWVYRSRHPYIAEILYEQVFTTAAERFDNTAKFITRLNPGYSYDRRIVGDLLRAGRMAEAIPDVVQGRAIYAMALESLGDEAHVYHQLGLYLKRRAGDMSSLIEAEHALDRALSLAPTDRTIKHSLAELAYSRAKIATDLIERAAWRAQAVAKATPLCGAANGSHAYHTLVKVHIMGLADAIAQEDDSQIAIDAVGEEIKRAEEAIRAGLQRFPGDSHLLAEEAELAKLLENDKRAEAALRRAFESNKKSVLIAKRYAFVLKARGDLDSAKRIIGECLEFNPGSQDLNYDFAELIRKLDPGSDINCSEQLLSYYRRSFTKGDKNYRAQLLCAREYALAGKHAEARQLFEHLKSAAVPFSIKSQVKELVRAAEGELRRFNGTVTQRRDTYGFVELDHEGISCYFNGDSLSKAEGLPAVGERVSLALGFSFMGPTAQHMSQLR